MTRREGEGGLVALGEERVGRELELGFPSGWPFYRYKDGYKYKSLDRRSTAKTSWAFKVNDHG